MEINILYVSIWFKQVENPAAWKRQSDGRVKKTNNIIVISHGGYTWNELNVDYYSSWKIHKSGNFTMKNKKQWTSRLSKYGSSRSQASYNEVELEQIIFFRVICGKNLKKIDQHNSHSRSCKNQVLWLQLDITNYEQKSNVSKVEK